jgi:predicted lipoprotein with Yx(FWY)xxD motif
MRIPRLVPVGLLCLAVAVVASQAAADAHTRQTAHAAAGATLSVHSSPYGKILVNSKGLTLYLFAKDKKDKSTCNSSCLAVWPFVIVKGKPTAGPGVNRKLLGTIKVKGGNEVTYNGWPLYTYVVDTKPGVITGEGSKSFGAPWWVVSPAGKAITKKP